MNTTIFTPLATYTTPGKADVIFGTTKDLDAFQKTNYFTETAIYVTIEHIRCLNIPCTRCPFEKVGNCEGSKALTIFPQFAIDFPELYI